MKVSLIWFDSMGAKSSCTKIETQDTSILIDPGVAVMQPSYPMSDEEKHRYRQQALRKIQKAGEDVDHIVISHYHYDHHPHPGFGLFDFKSLFKDCFLWMKDPNRWINDSQWERSRKFIKKICELFKGDGFEDLGVGPKRKDFEDPVDRLDHAMNKDYGDYQERREELLEKWSRRFEKWTERWSTQEWIREPDLSTYVHFADGESFEEGDTRVEFSPPLFHGIEYAGTGWVITTMVQDGTGYTFLHASDLQGPTIEDYADWIIDVDPDFLILDGPATYLLGFMLNKTNLQRSVDNATRILRDSDIDTFIYDHHLLREKRFKERTKKFWKAAEGEETQVVTAAELKGDVPLILKVAD